MTNATLRGKPDAGNPHVRFDEGEVAPATPRRGSLLYRRTLCLLILAFSASGAVGEEWRSLLPRPVFDEKPEYIDFYDKAWELAHEHIDIIPTLPVPRYMDEAHRSDRIWIWDTCFMVHFCKYCPAEFPGIESLENFYRIMMAEGKKDLPIVKGNVWSPYCGRMVPLRIHIPDNPPLFAWTEYAHALQTGDRARLEKVYAKERWLQRWFERFDSFNPTNRPYWAEWSVHIRKVADGYHWAGCPSGMDNTPRGLKANNPDLLWLDALAQQGLSALAIARIADILGRPDEAREWRSRYEVLKRKMNELYWDEEDGFYYDILEQDRSRVKVKTPASYWPMLAEMSSPTQARRMAAHVDDPACFGGVVALPSLARNDRHFQPGGGYWRGSMWLPTAYMSLKALDTYGEYATARRAARSIVAHMYETYRTFEPHTIWECYSPTEPKPSKHGKGYVRYDFCGWSALGPISLFIEDVIGIKQADAFENVLICDFDRAPKGRVGVENYRFGKVVCSVIATAETVEVKTNEPFTLVVDGARHSVPAGRTVLNRP